MNYVNITFSIDDIIEYCQAYHLSTGGFALEGMHKKAETMQGGHPPRNKVSKMRGTSAVLKSQQPPSLHPTPDTNQVPLSVVLGYTITQ